MMIALAHLQPGPPGKGLGVNLPDQVAVRKGLEHLPIWFSLPDKLGSHPPTFFRRFRKSGHQEQRTARFVREEQQGVLHLGRFPGIRRGERHDAHPPTPGRVLLEFFLNFFPVAAQVPLFDDMNGIGADEQKPAGEPASVPHADPPTQRTAEAISQRGEHSRCRAACG